MASLQGAVEPAEAGELRIRAAVALAAEEASFRAAGKARAAVLEAAVDVPAEVVEARRDDRDRQDVLHRRRHDVLATGGAGLVRHEAGVDQPHDDDRPEVELLGQHEAVEREIPLDLLGRRLREHDEVRSQRHHALLVSRSGMRDPIPHSADGSRSAVAHAQDLAGLRVDLDEHHPLRPGSGARVERDRPGSPLGNALGDVPDLLAVGLEGDLSRARSRAPPPW